MSTNESFSVVVVTHDHAATLDACLHAAAALEPKPSELVVVDNASVDGSAELAEKLGSRLIREDRNTGFAAAANRGIASTSAPWVLLLNPDCAPRPDYVERLLDAITHEAGSAGVGSATGKLLRAHGAKLELGSTLDAAGMVVTPAGRHLDRGSGELDRGQYDRPARVFGGSGAATLYRRSALDDVAYPQQEFLATSFFAYREDAELAWRLQLRGWSCRFEPSAVAAHQRGFQPEAGRAGHAAVNRHSVRNRFLLRLHCADWRWHLWCLPWWLLRDLLVIGACLSVETSSLGALAELWHLRSDIRTRRRWVQGRRTLSARQIQRWFRKRGQVEETGYR